VWPAIRYEGLHGATRRWRKPMAGSEDKGVWDPHGLLEPDFILPEQLYEHSNANRTGEFGLLWAVFVDGIQTYCREVLRGATRGLAYREVERWIFRPDSDALTSFSNLCELFGIDPRRMRRGLLRFRENPDAKVLDILKLNAA
ncbi:MAG: hypothetical protein ACREQ9_06410, partial [Candidatus Binatia bacterium]